MLKTKLNFEDYWKEFWDNDRTILMTKDEHNKISTDKFTGLWENISDKVFSRLISVFDVKCESSIFNFSQIFSKR